MQHGTYSYCVLKVLSGKWIISVFLPHTDTNIHTVGSGSTWFNSLLHYFLLPLSYSGLFGTNYSTLISASVVFYLLFLLKSHFPREPPMSFYLVIDSNIKEPLLSIMFKIAPSPSLILFPLYLTLFFFIPLELLHICN